MLLMTRAAGEAQISDAVVLMAGAGSRLGAFAKPLVAVGDRPLISYTLAALQSVGVQRIHAVMGATSDRLTQELTPQILPG